MTECKTRRDAALVMLQQGAGLSRKAGSFLGQLAVADIVMTPKQAKWWSDLTALHGVTIEEASDV